MYFQLAPTNSLGPVLTSALNSEAPYTSPPDVTQVNVVTHSATELVLEWTKVNNNPSYYYTLDSNGIETNITASEGGSTVTHTVSSLSPGTRYTFTLFTVFEGVRSRGFEFSAATVPTATSVTVTYRNTTALSLEWSTANNTDYILMLSSGRNITFTSPPEDKVTHTIGSLLPGTIYNFTLFNTFESVTQKYEFATITKISCVDSPWIFTSTTIEAEVPGLYSMATAKNNYQGGDVNGIVEGNKVSFSNLYPGATYSVSFYYLLDEERLLQCSHSVTLVPAAVTSLSCEGGDYSVFLKWEEPFGLWTEAEVNVIGIGSQLVSRTDVKIAGLEPSRTYNISVTSLSGAVRGPNQWTSCHTTSSMVVLVPEVVIMLLGLLTSMGYF
ncbi:hypothetical protein AALO_G00277910 [Alosa alosa]|uniref:Fibronectin type-III domain-containing protein n=1 Tax=Alosa alosa TaxID=278164 RepID=A0AAV6FNN4_9TELE|nr:hypothetical protein AALO_G00277910 [Alosa alosa]